MLWDGDGGEDVSCGRNACVLCGFACMCVCVRMN